jgi:hypothetical protein
MQSQLDPTVNDPLKGKKQSNYTFYRDFLSIYALLGCFAIKVPFEKLTNGELNFGELCSRCRKCPRNINSRKPARPMGRPSKLMPQHLCDEDCKRSLWMVVKGVLSCGQVLTSLNVLSSVGKVAYLIGL